MTTPRETALRRLREADPIASAGIAGTPLAEGVSTAGIGFAAVGGPLEERWHRALGELQGSIAPFGEGAPVLREGGPYPGTWIESTGTISTDVLGRWAPQVARDTLLQFAVHQRDDGMIPYKITADGPGFSQIQIVTPLARVVWRHHLAVGGDLELLRIMHPAMVRYDAWLARYRDTRGTGGVEAFCTFDTGHDLSPRFWFAPDRAFGGDARFCDPASSTMPYVAPDLTANLVCQRRYLALIAEALGEDPQPWRDAAAESEAALWEQCFDEDDRIFYDRDRNDRLVRVQSDVLLRVLACEIGDDAFFATALTDYLLNTRKFLAHYGFTSLAMDDPRFDHDAGRNSWGGPVNFLALLRAPDAFEQHGRVAELAAASMPVLQALAVADRFPQCLDPWSGDAGYTDSYSPAILWLLDAVDRHCGILPRPDGSVWLSTLTPTRLDHGAAAQAVAARRVVPSGCWELAADDERADVWRDGEHMLSFPRGWRLELDAAGAVRAVIGLASAPVRGELIVGAERVELEVAPNERVELDGVRVVGRRTPGFTPPGF